MQWSQRWNTLHTEIRTQLVVICDPMCYQLDQGGALINYGVSLTLGNQIHVKEAFLAIIYFN